MITTPRQVMSRPKTSMLYTRLFELVQKAYGEASAHVSIQKAHYSEGKLSVLEVANPNSKNQVDLHYAPNHTPIIHCTTTVHFND